MANAEPTAADLDLMADGTGEVPEVMHKTGLRHSQIYAGMASGEIPYVQLGRKRVIPWRGMWRYLARNVVNGDATR